MQELKQRSSDAMRRRKSLRRQIVNKLGCDPGLRWVHGVLYDREGTEHARVSDDARGVDGLEKPQNNYRYHAPTSRNSDTYSSPEPYRAPHQTYRRW